MTNLCELIAKAKTSPLTEEEYAELYPIVLARMSAIEYIFRRPNDTVTLTFQMHGVEILQSFPTVSGEWVERYYLTYDLLELSDEDFNTVVSAGKLFLELEEAEDAYLSLEREVNTLKSNLTPAMFMLAYDLYE